MNPATGSAKRTPEQWLETFRTVLAQEGRTLGGANNLPAKLRSCRPHTNGLRDIWTNVANREKSTRDLVRQILSPESSGMLSFSRVNNGNRVEVQQNVSIGDRVEVKYNGKYDS